MGTSTRRVWALWLLIPFIVGLVAVSCTEQPELTDTAGLGRWELFDTGNQLPGNAVQDILIDSQGRTWFAIFGKGVTVLDNGNWTTYTTSNSDITTNYISCIEEALNGDIWFGTANGVCWFDGSIWNYWDGDGTQYRVDDLKQLSTGEMVLGTRFNFVIVYENGEFEPYQLNPLPELNTVNDIEEDLDGNVWVATDYGVVTKGSLNEWFTTDDGLPSDEVWALHCDSRGRVWIGTTDAIYTVYYSGGEFYAVPYYTCLYTMSIVDIEEDSNGDIWFGTYVMGVMRYDEVTMYPYTYSRGFFDDYITDIEDDGKGTIWVGSDFEGAVRYRFPVKY